MSNSNQQIVLRVKTAPVQASSDVLQIVVHSNLEHPERWSVRRTRTGEPLDYVHTAATKAAETQRSDRWDAKMESWRGEF